MKGFPGSAALIFRENEASENPDLLHQIALIVLIAANCGGRAGKIGFYTKFAIYENRNYVDVALRRLMAVF